MNWGTVNFDQTKKKMKQTNFPFWGAVEHNLKEHKEKQINLTQDKAKIDLT